MRQNIPLTIHSQISTFLWKEDFEYTVDDTGMDNIVYIIEDEYILRLARQTWYSFQQEIELINYISKYTSISLPIPILQDDAYQRFMYKKIEWATTDISKRLSQLEQPNYNNLVHQLATFMRDIHNLAYHRYVASIGIKMYDKSRNNYNNLKELWSQITERHYKIRIEYLLTTYSQYQEKHMPITLWLLHNDLYGNHFLTDLNTWNITWVIDFTDITIGDIQIDFMFLYDPHTNFQNDVIDTYINITNTIVDKDFVRLCTQIFITYHYLKYRRTTQERSWAKDRVDNRIRNN